MLILIVIVFWWCGMVHDITPLYLITKVWSIFFISTNETLPLMQNTISSVDDIVINEITNSLITINDYSFNNYAELNNLQINMFEKLDIIRSLDMKNINQMDVLKDFFRMQHDFAEWQIDNLFTYIENHNIATEQIFDIMNNSPNIFQRIVNQHQ